MSANQGVERERIAPFPYERFRVIEISEFRFRTFMIGEERVSCVYQACCTCWSGERGGSMTNLLVICACKIRSCLMEKRNFGDDKVIAKFLAECLFDN